MNCDTVERRARIIMTMTHIIPFDFNETARITSMWQPVSFEAQDHIKPE